MTERRSPTRFSVGQRLAVGLLPALLAVVLVLALAVWGEYGRQAPEAVVAGSALLAVVSLAITWVTSRDLSRRINRLSSTVGRVRAMLGESASDSGDALDDIEETLEHLRTALKSAEQARADAERRAAAAARGQSRLIEQTVLHARAHLDEVQLPVHILLDSRFGGLNENQEELLAAARDAAERMDRALRQLETIATADAEGLPVHAAAVSPNDLIRAVEPQLRALAERQQRPLVVDLEPALPRVWVDRAKLATALVLLAEIAAREVSGAEMRVRTRHPATDGASRSNPSERPLVLVELEPFPLAAVGAITGHSPETTPNAPLDATLAARLLQAQGAHVRQVGATLRIELPRI